MIYISTGGDRMKTGYECAVGLKNAGFNFIELSGGAPDDTQLEKLRSLLPGVFLQVHNYFPPPAEPFVLNLASLNNEVARKSMEHVRKSIRWAIALDKPVYSVHAGFLFDPLPADLGKKIARTQLAPREVAFGLFVERIKLLAGEFASDDVTLLIENNVLSAKNLENFTENPFLLVDGDECVRFMENMPANVGLLIDVAHLKVSALSLGFEPVQMLFKCAPWTYAYHLSDNDGLTDSNDELQKDSWFWPHLKKDVNFYVLEVYNKLPSVLKEQLELVEKMLKKQ